MTVPERIESLRMLRHATSLSVQSDGKVAKGLSVFDGRPVVFTDKMVGENITFNQGVSSSSLVQDAAQGIDPEQQEGFVVRQSPGFDFADVQRAVIKRVRARHVRPSACWQSDLITPKGSKAVALT